MPIVPPKSVKTVTKPKAVAKDKTTPPVEVPAVEVPAVEVPAVEVPAVEVPAVEVPAVEVPVVPAKVKTKAPVKAKASVKAKVVALANVEPEVVDISPLEEEDVVSQETDVNPGKQGKDKVPLSTKEFGEKLKKISDAIANLSVLEETIASIPKGESLRYQDLYIHKRDASSFRTTIRSEVDSLRKHYDVALKYRKTFKSDNKRVVQFVRKLKPEAAQIICSNESNLGKVDGKEMYELLPLAAKENLILNTTLMSLASIYSRKNKLGTSGNSLKASPHMCSVLEPFRSELESKGFKFDNFNCTRWSTVWSVLKSDITPAERTVLMNTHREQLLIEEAIVAKVLQNLK